MLLALSTALVVGAIQGQARWADVGLNAVYCAFAINMFFLLRGPETFVIHRGGVTWRWRAYRWRDIYGFEAHPERKGPNLSLKTRRERVEIPIPADRLQETTATLEAFRPRFNRPRAALTAIPAST